MEKIGRELSGVHCTRAISVLRIDIIFLFTQMNSVRYEFLREHHHLKFATPLNVITRIAISSHELHAPMIVEITHLNTSGDDKVIEATFLFPFRHTLVLRADSRLTASQRETSLQSNAVSHWLGANLA